MRREHWHLTEGIVFLHFAVYFLAASNPASLQALALAPPLVAQRPWTLLTFQFIHLGLVELFFSLLILWFFARPLEERWGSPRFLVFWLVSVLGAGMTALLFGQVLAGDVFLQTSLLFTFATLYPDMEILLFFILPVKVKWLALIGGTLLVYGSFARFGLLGGLANAAGMSAGYVFFLATRNLPSRRKLAFELKKAKGSAAAAARDLTVERRNRELGERLARTEASLASGDGPGEEGEALLRELERAVDPTVTICAPEDFGALEDPVCRTCPGFPECAARRLRSLAGPGDGSEDPRKDPAS